MVRNLKEVIISGKGVSTKNFLQEEEEELSGKPLGEL